MHQVKSFELKASENGSIKGYFSTWTREPDAVGDVVAKGAFVESFAHIEEKGGTVPFLWNHQSDDLKSYIGTAYGFGEDEHGAYFEASFDDTEEAQRARELALDGRLCKFSFAYDVLDSGEVTLEDGRKANELRKLELFEVSLVMYPANPDTSVIEVKAAGLKSGRRNSAKDAKELERIGSLASEIKDAVSGLLEAVSEGEATDSLEDAKSADEERPSAEFVDAYKQAIKTLLKGRNNG